MKSASASDKKLFLKSLLQQSEKTVFLELAKTHGLLVDDENIVRLSSELKSMQLLAQRRLQTALDMVEGGAASSVSTKTTIVPDPEALLSHFEDILAQKSRLIITRGVLDELDFVKLVNPVQRERVQVVLRGIDGAHKSGTVQLTSAPMTPHRGLFRFHQELLSVVSKINISIQEEKEDSNKEEYDELIVLTDSPVFQKALAEISSSIKIMHPRQLPKRR